MNWRFWDRAGQDNCAAIEPLLSLYSDEMASSAEKRRVESHLAECPECRQALDWMLSTRQVISQRPSLTPPLNLRARIARAIAEADAAKAGPVKAPAAPVSTRPSRRPWVLRPAFAYGFSLILLAGIATDFAWNASHPTQNQIAVQPMVSQPIAPQVASNVPSPRTSAVIDSMLGHVNRTLHSALVAPSPSVGRHSITHTIRIFRSTPVPAESLPTSQPEHVALKPRLQIVPHLSPLPRKTSVIVTHMASQPRQVRPVLTPKPILSAPRIDNHQVASADTVPHEETHTPTVMSPPSVPVSIGPPTVTHDVHQVADRSPSTREVLSEAMASMHNVTLTSNTKFAKMYTAAAEVPTERVGFDIVQGPVH